MKQKADMKFMAAALPPLTILVVQTIFLVPYSVSCELITHPLSAEHHKSNPPVGYSR